MEQARNSRLVEEQTEKLRIVALALWIFLMNT